MANLVEMAEVPLIGRGYCFKPRGSYAPGEYREMLNVELNEDGSLRNRRPVRTLTEGMAIHGDVQANSWDNFNGFVGYWKDQAVVAGHTCQRLVTQGSSSVLWDPTPLNADGHRFNAQASTEIDDATDWRKIVGFFRYNRMNYWIIQTYIANQPVTAKRVVNFHLLYSPDVNGSLSLVTLGGCTAVDLFTLDLSTAPVNGTPDSAGFTFPLFLTHFIHKERLWIVTSNNLYFSKATDPTVFATPDGGFFNFNEAGVNDAVPLRDSIYIVCENSVHALTYSTDPNTNSALRQVADSVGGDSACVWGDKAYFARDNALYSITDQYIERVMKLDLYNDQTHIDGGDRKFWKLEAAGDYIVALRRRWTITSSGTWPPVGSGNSSPPVTGSGNWPTIYRYFATTTVDEDGPVEPDAAGIEPPQHDAFFINMNLNAVHAFSTYQIGRLSDVYFVPNESGARVQNLYFMYTIGALGGGPNYTDNYFLYMSMSSDETDEASQWDFIYRATNAISARAGMPIALEFDGIMPDNTELYLKRYRTLLMEINAFTNMKVVYGFDNEAFSARVNILDTMYGLGRAPFSMQLPLNQKARSFNIKLFKSYDDAISLGTESPSRSYFMLKRMLLHWTPTGKAPIGSRPFARDNGS